MATKTCRSCGGIFPATNDYFYFAKRGKLGLDSVCKVCKKAKNAKYNAENAKAKNEHNRLYREQNREKLNSHNREYYAKHKEQAKQYRDDNREKHILYKREWYRNNKDTRLEACREYYLQHQEIIKRYSTIHGKEHRQKPYVKLYRRINQQKRYASTCGLLSTLTVEEWELCLRFFNNSCSYCDNKNKLEQDHVIPVTNGGGYVSKNIIPACKICNPSKSNHNMEVWYRKQPFFSEDRLNKIKQWASTP